MSNTCERVEFDNEGEKNDFYCLLFGWREEILMSSCLIIKEDPKRESKEDQWMGVTVQSQGPGGKIVVSDSVFCTITLSVLLWVFFFK